MRWKYFLGKYNEKIPTPSLFDVITVMGDFRKTLMLQCWLTLNASLFPTSMDPRMFSAELMREGEGEDNWVLKSKILVRKTRESFEARWIWEMEDTLCPTKEACEIRGTEDNRSIGLTYELLNPTRANCRVYLCRASDIFRGIVRKQSVGFTWRQSFCMFATLLPFHFMYSCRSDTYPFCQRKQNNPVINCLFRHD